MLVLQAVVLFVHTDDVLQQDGAALRVASVAVEIFDMAEAVAAQGELVGVETKADVADVEGLFAVEGGSGV